MGTRGIYGVHVGGIDKLAYNHFDSYPSGLGNDILKQYKKLMKNKTLSEVKHLAIVLEGVDSEKPPTPKQKKLLSKYSNTTVSEQSDDDWYCLMRELQGNIAETLRVGLYLPNEDFILDSLFCEWAYILNFDTNKLEVYKGFQKKKHNKGRFSKGAKRDSYYPCALIAEYDLDKLPDDLEAELAEVVEEE